MFKFMTFLCTVKWKFVYVCIAKIMCTSIMYCKMVVGTIMYCKMLVCISMYSLGACGLYPSYLHSKSPFLDEARNRNHYTVGRLGKPLPQTATLLETGTGTDQPVLHCK